MKNLLIFGPFCEWNDFVNFNSYLYQIKNNYNKIIAIVPDKATDIVTEADSFLTISNEYLDKHNANYPNVLENQGTAPPILTPNGPVLISNRNQSDFYQKVITYITSHQETYKDYELKFYEQEENLYTDLAQNIYTKLFKNLEKWILDGNLTYPTKKNFSDMKQQYGYLFTNKTYILLTRNFKNKVPQENTHVAVPNLEKVVKKLTENKIKIINIGFPPSHFNISNENYIEIEGHVGKGFSQGELIALFYLSNGVLLSGINGGFTAHISSNADCFLIAPELWSRSILNLSIFEAKMLNNTVASIDLTKDFVIDDINKILSILSMHTKIAINKFIQEKEKVYVA